MKHQCVLPAILAGVFLLSSTLWALCPSADLSGDCSVDLEDFSRLAEQWLMPYDPNDLAVFAEQWLTEGIPADPEVMLWVSINEPDFIGQMSAYETTNAQYAQFLNDALAAGEIVIEPNYVKGANGADPNYYYRLDGPGRDTNDGAINGGAARIHYSNDQFVVDIGFEDHPVTYVSWYGAKAFCDYYGYRLPTESEWQAVADFDGSFVYGCGPSINNTIANYYQSTHPDGTTVVGTWGSYGYGMCDTAGNVMEWTSTVLDGGPVLCGGSWNTRDEFCVISFQAYGSPDRMYPITGFRVCR